MSARAASLKRAKAVWCQPASYPDRIFRSNQSFRLEKHLGIAARRRHLVYPLSRGASDAGFAASQPSEHPFSGSPRARVRPFDATKLDSHTGFPVLVTLAPALLG
jgi:hypothetical protein